MASRLPSELARSVQNRQVDVIPQSVSLDGPKTAVSTVQSRRSARILHLAWNRRLKPKMPLTVPAWPVRSVGVGVALCESVSEVRGPLRVLFALSRTCPSFSRTRSVALALRSITRGTTSAPFDPVAPSVFQALVGSCWSRLARRCALCSFLFSLVLCSCLLPSLALITSFPLPSASPVDPKAPSSPSSASHIPYTSKGICFLLLLLAPRPLLSRRAPLLFVILVIILCIILSTTVSSTSLTPVISVLVVGVPAIGDLDGLIFCINFTAWPRVFTYLLSSSFLLTCLGCSSLSGFPPASSVDRSPQALAPFATHNSLSTIAPEAVSSQLLLC